MSDYVLADPSSLLNWSHDWSDWLEDGAASPTDEIASRQWTITPLNAGSPTTPVLIGDTTDIVFVSGLQLGKIYHLTEHIVTSAGVEDQRTIVIRCEQT